MVLVGGVTENYHVYTYLRHLSVYISKYVKYSIKYVIRTTFKSKKNNFRIKIAFSCFATGIFIGPTLYCHVCSSRLTPYRL
jgi:hypothetical protein